MTKNELFEKIEVPPNFYTKTVPTKICGTIIIEELSADLNQNEFINRIQVLCNFCNTSVPNKTSVRVVTKKDFRTGMTKNELTYNYGTCTESGVKALTGANADDNGIDLEEEQSESLVDCRLMDSNKQHGRIIEALR